MKSIYRSCVKNGRNHWLAVSTYNCPRGEVYLMDSYFCGTVNDHIKRQICSILNCTEDLLKINVVSVQQQTNGVDCGLFAISFVHHILSENCNPEDLRIDPVKLRPHLLRCLTANEITQFPLTGTDVRKNTPDCISVPIFCSCRMPFSKSDLKNREKQMVECSGCSGWFHRMCERIPANIFHKSNKDSKWFCYTCKN